MKSGNEIFLNVHARHSQVAPLRKTEGLWLTLHPQYYESNV